MTIDPPWRFDPLQNPVNVNWGGAAVEFSSGALLYRPSLSLADTGKLTISTWVRVPVAGIYANILEIGDSDHQQSRISISDNGSVIDSLQATFVGPIVFDSVLEVNSSLGISLGSTGVAVPFATWLHIFTALSWDYSSTIDAPGPWPFKLFAQGVSVGNYSGSYGLVEASGGQTGAEITGASGIKLNGAQLGIPLAKFNFDLGDRWLGPHQRADTMIWVGQYIDPDVHIAKFYRDGKRVRSQVAIDAFGEPTFKMLGGAASFIDNPGTGGTLTKFLQSDADYIKNYTPAPLLFTE